MSPILVQIDFLLVINTNLPHILHCFQAIAFDKSEIATFDYPSLIPTMEGFTYTISSWYIAKN